MILISKSPVKRTRVSENFFQECSTFSGFFVVRFMNPAQTITLYQPLLHRIAYNLVRCQQDAEDIVQETFVRWLTVDHEKIENTKAYLIRAVTNNCLNHLQALKRKKEEYLDALHMPEFLIKWKKEMNLQALDMDVNLQAAFQVLHQKLEPLERAVFVLKEVFDWDYDELQQALDKKKDHCRQLLARARKKIDEETSTLHFDLPNAHTLIKRFRASCDVGNASEYLQQLKSDIAEAVQKKIQK
jgi:RNA polymerase sigma-70 factor (ECF subfamily)